MIAASNDPRSAHPLLGWLRDPFLLLTQQIPGTGGTIRREPEDFVVEEIPAYEPCGEGEHLFLWIEKRLRTTDELKRDLAQTLHIRADDVGSAGLKDRNAVTRQYLSVPIGAFRQFPGEPEEIALTVPLRDAGILRAARHRNKLRTGHLRGNRFEIRIRDPLAGALERAHESAVILSERGVPNYYGEQRFGRDGETVQMGLTILGATAWPPATQDAPPADGADVAPESGDASPTSDHRMRQPRVSRTLRRLALSSVQSTLFNRALAGRLQSGLLHRVLAGDVMQVVRSGGVFVAEGAEEQARYESKEIVITGPMYGPRMVAAEGEPGASEAALLAASGLTMADFAAAGGLLEGTRRAYVIWPEAMVVESLGSDLLLRFELPAGAYATVLLREIMKEGAGQ